MPGHKKTKPYASDAQRKKLHVLAEEGEISKAEVARKDAASKGMDLPEHVKPHKKHRDH